MQAKYSFWKIILIKVKHDFNNAHLQNQCKNPILRIKLVCCDDNTNTDLGEI